MGFFTEQKYSYWEWQESSEGYTVKMKDINAEKVDERITQLIESVKELKKDKESKIKERENCSETELTKIQHDIMDIESRYRSKYEEGKRVEEGYLVYQRYHSITYRVKRLKDSYSCQEAVYLQIVNDGRDDGIIISTVSKIAEDINKVEDYGISMQPYYLDELAKIIRNHYFDMNVTESSYIDNNVPKRVVEDFVEFCRQKMGKDMQEYLSQDKIHYDVKTTTLNDWYKESPFRRYAFKEIKEAMIIHQYVDKPTKGRTDCTIAGQKVIRFFKKELDGITYVEDEK